MGRFALEPSIIIIIMSENDIVTSVEAISVCDTFLIVLKCPRLSHMMLDFDHNGWYVCNVWQNFVPPSFDDKILEVVAVFGGMQIAVSRLIDIQHHRIAQVRTLHTQASELRTVHHFGL